jgi:hypothetical protein
LPYLTPAVELAYRGAGHQEPDDPPLEPHDDRQAVRGKAGAAAEAARVAVRPRVERIMMTSRECEVRRRGGAQ